MGLTCPGYLHLAQLVLLLVLAAVFPVVVVPVVAVTPALEMLKKKNPRRVPVTRTTAHSSLDR
jgi:hypothetical protein